MINNETRKLVWTAWETYFGDPTDENLADLMNAIMLLEGYDDMIQRLCQEADEHLERVLKDEQWRIGVDFVACLASSSYLDKIRNRKREPLPWEV